MEGSVISKTCLSKLRRAVTVLWIRSWIKNITFPNRPTCNLHSFRASGMNITYPAFTFYLVSPRKSFQLCQRKFFKCGIIYPIISSSFERTPVFLGFCRLRHKIEERRASVKPQQFIRIQALCTPWATSGNTIPWGLTVFVAWWRLGRRRGSRVR